MRLQLVFFRVLWTVICETSGAMPSSTTFSAKSRTVQRAYPSGAAEQAKVVNRAANDPSNRTSTAGLGRTLCSRLASTPSSNTRRFRFSIVRQPRPNALATFCTVHFGPKSLASHNSSVRAATNFLAEVLLVLVIFSKEERSSGELNGVARCHPRLLTFSDHSSISAALKVT